MMSTFFPPNRWRTNKSGDALYPAEQASYTLITADVAEDTPMEAGMITVSADYLEDEIDRFRFVAIFDARFGADSAEIKEESRGAHRDRRQRYVDLGITPLACRPSPAFRTELSGASVHLR